MNLKDYIKKYILIFNKPTLFACVAYIILLTLAVVYAVPRTISLDASPLNNFLGGGINYSLVDYLFTLSPYILLSFIPLYLARKKRSEGSGKIFFKTLLAIFIVSNIYGLVVLGIMVADQSLLYLKLKNIGSNAPTLEFLNYAFTDQDKNGKIDTLQIKTLLSPGDTSEGEYNFYAKVFYENVAEKIKIEKNSEPKELEFNFPIISFYRTLSYYENFTKQLSSFSKTDIKLFWNKVDEGRPATGYGGNFEWICRKALFIGLDNLCEVRIVISAGDFNKTYNFKERIIPPPKSDIESYLSFDELKVKILSDQGEDTDGDGKFNKILLSLEIDSDRSIPVLVVGKVGVSNSFGTEKVSQPFTLIKGKQVIKLPVEKVVNNLKEGGSKLKFHYIQIGANHPGSVPVKLITESSTVGVVSLSYETKTYELKDFNLSTEEKNDNTFNYPPLDIIP